MRLLAKRERERVGPTGRSIKDNGPTRVCPRGDPVLPQLTNEHSLFVSNICSHRW